MAEIIPGQFAPTSRVLDWVLRIEWSYLFDKYLISHVRKMRPIVHGVCHGAERALLLQRPVGSQPRWPLQLLLPFGFLARILPTHLAWLALAPVMGI